MTRPDRTVLAPGLEISRVVTGLWQVADMERGGRALDRDAAAAAMAEYARAGFDSFDMADHYGSAELITGRFLTLPGIGRPSAFTKWCPAPEAMTPEVVRAGVQERLDRLGVAAVDLLQLHWWTFEHPGYIDAMKEMAALRDEGRIRHLGLTNFDTDHLRLLVKHGFPVVSNQVSFSLLDRRAAEDMSAFCLANGVRLLAYGTLGGGFLTDRWVGQPEPDSIADWSKSKYKRFIDTVGGWDALQGLLQALAEVARVHGVSVANVATRWVLEQPAVAAVIVGARLGEREHRADNLALFSFSLDADDRALIDEALQGLRRIPGDCGDEYRRPPFLTASGDLSHHLESIPPFYRAVSVEGRPDRLRIDSGSVWEPICGYSRAVRVGERILVSGTTATHGSGEMICPDDPHGQAVYILDKIAASVAALGGRLEDVVRTRVYLRDADQWEPVSRVHGRYFGAIRPANTLLEVGRLVGDYAVEIEAEAIVSGR
ncbi:MAG TPA: aldo/keto reductase [Microvirga sp.]|jgi:aryl-alcohol dehydrogenase-like predicted oxidoreductase/enamine deaminase RidA (YjgF/YER057c/UK114 family)|nr:aldo/keto reductase [Microvirga sp.]